MDPNPDSGPKKDAQGRRWCLTLYEENDLHLLRQVPHDACVVAWETGVGNDNRHLQTYIKFSTNKRWSWFKKTLSESAHFDKAVGEEWQCRRYIADVESYLRDNPNAHFKEQGEIVHDYGCDIHLDEDAPTDVRVVKGLVEGARLSAIFKANPMYYFHNSRKIRDLYADIQGWREAAEDYTPADIQPYKKARKARPPKDD